MKQQLQKSFFQTFTGTTIWLTFILTKFFIPNQSISVNYLWNIIGVSLISALLFGLMYNALWNHLTLKPIWNILIASSANMIGGLSAILLLFPSVFTSILPWSIIFFIINIALHTIGFYFYGKYESKKQAEFLNKAVKQ